MPTHVHQMLVNVGIEVLHPYIRKRWKAPFIPLKAFQKHSSLVVNFPTVLFVFHTIHWVSLVFLLGLELELQRGERQPWRPIQLC